jgi:hypothetical protein
VRRFGKTGHRGNSGNDSNHNNHGNIGKLGINGKVSTQCNRKRSLHVESPLLLFVLSRVEGVSKFWTKSPILIFTQTSPVEVEFLMWRDRRTNIMKLIVALQVSFSNAPEI